MDPGRHAPRRRRRVWPWLLAAVVLGFLAFGVDVVWMGSSAASDLERAQDELEDGAHALEAGNLAEAENDFAAAESDAAGAIDALGHPGPRLLGTLPWVGDDVHAARRIAEAARLSAQAGGALVEAAAAIGWDGGDLPGFAPGGQIDADLLASAAPALGRAARSLDLAAQEVAPIDPDTLLGPLRGPARGVKREIDTRAEQARTLALATEVLPAMLGAEGDRSYLLVTLNTSDPRGAGGYPGAYSVLRTDGDRIVLDPLRPVGTIPEVPPVDAPEEVVKRWRSKGSLTTFWNTTYTPDYPTAARLMLGIWEAAGNEPVDGVIAVDATMLAGLLEVLGPVDSPAWPETITADNVERILGADVFMTTSQAESDLWESRIGDAVWAEILTRPWPARPTAEAFGRAVDGEHLQVYATDPQVQDALVTLGVDGKVELPPDDEPFVVVNGLTANRAGFYASYDVEVDETTQPDGTVVTTVTTTLTNDAPADCPPSILCGTGPGARGTFGASVNVYMPVGARLLRTSTDGRPGLAIEAEEFGRPVAVSLVVAPPQGTSVSTVRYEVPADPTG
jgi:hypothetical protein